MAHDCLSRRSVITGTTTAAIAGLSGCLGTSGSSGSSANGSSGNNTQGGQSNGGGKTELTLGCSTQGSATMAAGQAIKRALNEFSDTVRINTTQTQGAGPANFRLFDQGQTDGGGYDNFSAPNAYAGTGQFADSGVEDIPQQGFKYLTIQMFPLARKDTDINSISDLKGKNVYLNPPGVGVRPPVDAVLKNYNMLSEITPLQMSRSDVPGALEEGRIDALYVYGINRKGLPGWVTQVDSRVSLKGIKGNKEYKQAIKKTKGVPYTTVDPKSFDFNNNISAKNLPAWSQAYQFRFGGYVQKSVVNEIARIVHKRNDFIVESDSNFTTFDKAKELRSSYLPKQPVHRGVASYLKKNNAWKQSLKVGPKTTK